MGVRHPRRARASRQPGDRRRPERAPHLRPAREGGAAGHRALEPAHHGRAAVPGEHAVADPLAVQPAGLRAAVLRVAGDHGGAQAVPRLPRSLPARAGARHALRRLAAGRHGVRLRPLARDLARVPARERLGADPVAPVAGRPAALAARRPLVRAARGGRRRAVPRRPPRVELPRAARDGRVRGAASLPAAARRPAAGARAPAAPLRRVARCGRRAGGGRAAAVPRARAALGRPRAARRQRRGRQDRAALPARLLPLRLLGPLDGHAARAVPARARLLRRSAAADAGRRRADPAAAARTRGGGGLRRALHGGAWSACRRSSRS